MGGRRGLLACRMPAYWAGSPWASLSKPQFLCLWVRVMKPSPRMVSGIGDSSDQCRQGGWEEGPSPSGPVIIANHRHSAESRGG